MPHTVSDALCDSIQRKSRSLTMRKSTVSCVAVTARLTWCRKKFDHYWRRRRQLTMRILVAGGSLSFVAVSAFLVSLASACPHPPYRVSVAGHSEARLVDI